MCNAEAAAHVAAFAAVTSAPRAATADELTGSSSFTYLQTENCHNHPAVAMPMYHLHVEFA